MSLIEKTATELHALLTKGEVSSRELAATFCDRIEAVEGKVKALLHHDRSMALAQAETIDAARKAGKPVGKLAGLPVIVKDILCTRGEPTTCASRMLENFSAPYDAHVITRLNEEGGVRIARANMDEFAMGSSCENSAFQKREIPGISIVCREDRVAAPQRPWPPKRPLSRLERIPAEAFASRHPFVGSWG